MQQDYVCLHTLKNLDEMEKTIKQLGMEIIFKSSYAYFNPEDLSNEERAAWIDALQERIERNLESAATFSKSLENLAVIGKNHALEILSLLKRYRENPSNEILDSMNNLNNIAHARFKYIYDLRTSPLGMIEFIASPSNLRVSCLIARKGENVVRYISIRENNDPILTIIGPEASSIKEALKD